MKSPVPVIEYYENRGSETDPFGFIYFTDGARVGYSPGIKDCPPVWPGNWGPVTESHLKTAVQMLVEKGLIH